MFTQNFKTQMNCGNFFFIAKITQTEFHPGPAGTCSIWSWQPLSSNQFSFLKPWKLKTLILLFIYSYQNHRHIGQTSSAKCLLQSGFPEKQNGFRFAILFHPNIWKMAKNRVISVLKLEKRYFGKNFFTNSLGYSSGIQPSKKPTKIISLSLKHSGLLNWGIEKS